MSFATRICASMGSAPRTRTMPGRSTLTRAPARESPGTLASPFASPLPTLPLSSALRRSRSGAASLAPRRRGGVEVVVVVLLVVVLVLVVAVVVVDDVVHHRINIMTSIGARVRTATHARVDAQRGRKC